MVGWSEYNWYHNPKPNIIDKYRIFYECAIDKYSKEQDSEEQDLGHFITNVKTDALNRIRPKIGDGVDYGTFASDDEEATAVAKAASNFDMVSGMLPAVNNTTKSLNKMGITTVSAFIDRLK